MQIRSSLQIQYAVFLALFQREVKTRFGGFRLGYFWAVFEPLAHILILSFLISFIRDDDIDLYGAPFPVIFGLGILGFFAFQKVVIVSQNSIQVNLGLFCYRQVKPLDTVLVRYFIETLINLSVVVFVAILGAWVFGYNLFPADPLGFLVTMLLISILGLGFGLPNSVLGVLHQEWAQLVSIFMRPLYFISGVFFPLKAMPVEVHPYLLWNPILHGIEELRESWIHDYTSDQTSIFYLLAWAITTLLLGLLYFSSKKHVVIAS